MKGFWVLHVALGVALRCDLVFGIRISTLGSLFGRALGNKGMQGSQQDEKLAGRALATKQEILAPTGLRGLRVKGHEGWFYYTDVEFGDPPQHFLAAIDIGWSDTFVPSTKCTENHEYCTRHNLYNSSYSSSYQKNGTRVSMVYHRGQSGGYASTDTLRIGDLTIANQSFEETIIMETNALDDIYDSVLPLPRLRISDLWSTLGATSPFHNMIDQNLLKHNIFSLMLSDSSVDREGELLFGAINEDLYSEYLNTFPAIEGTANFPILNQALAAGWNLAARSISFGFSNEEPLFTWNLSGYTVALSTSWPMILLPNRIVRVIAGYFGDPPSGEIDCDRRDNLPDLTILLGDDPGIPFILKPNDYIREEPDFRVFPGGGNCQIELFGMPEEDEETPILLLGSVFLARFYSVFDYDNATISLANLKV
ncbi:MAG: Vacuolar protease A [Bogoriella megaspora]|nr:MAG: Vacuolar protease A [Bogoriella megaspora]